LLDRYPAQGRGWLNVWATLAAKATKLGDGSKLPINGGEWYINGILMVY